jgi:hypothetical protein
MFIGIKDRVLMEQEKTRLEAQDACLRDEMRAQLNFGDIIGELRSLKKSTAVSTPDANRVRMSSGSVPRQSQWTLVQ